MYYQFWYKKKEETMVGELIIHDCIYHGTQPCLGSSWGHERTDATDLQLT